MVGTPGSHSRAWDSRAAGGWLCLIAAFFLSACASHKAPTLDTAGGSSLAAYIARVRALASEARPAPPANGQSVESWSSALAVALLELNAAPTADAHRLVAREYRRLGILDVAHEHLVKALKLDPKDAAAHDALARIWRDWGFPHLGMTDALRAVQLAPTSPEAANTVGTLFQAMGHLESARVWYNRALRLNPSADYALTNVCYTAVMLRDPNGVPICERAVLSAPESKTALNNLGLAYAARGDFMRAREQFVKAGDAAADYNMGIVYMATRQYQRAVESFDAALLADPRSTLVAARARQARAHAARDGN